MVTQRCESFRVVNYLHKALKVKEATLLKTEFVINKETTPAQKVSRSIDYRVFRER